MLEGSSTQYNVAVDCLAIPGNLAYYKIPTNMLRSSVDSLFPVLAKCREADYLSGAYHRFRGGHDLIVDIAKTMQDKGFAPALRQVGHITLTDFPTKAGIPIPGFSGTGIGKHLADLGIGKGWLCVNMSDASVGVLAIAESSSDLLQAFSGQLDMNVWTFFDTFVEGGVEIAIACHTENPMLLCAGIENVLAGIIATGKALEEYLKPFYVDPVMFLGRTFCTGIIGFAISALILKKEADTSLLNAMKSGAVSALFVLSPTFAYGSMAAFAIIGFGEYLAKLNTESVNSCLYWDQAAVCAYMLSAETAFPGFADWYMMGQSKLTLDSKRLSMRGDVSTLLVRMTRLSAVEQTLQSELSIVKGESFILPSAKILCDSVPMCLKTA